LTAFVALESYDPVIDPNPPLIEERYARFIFEAPQPPPPPPEDLAEPDEDEEADADAPEETERPSRATPSSEPSASSPSERQAALTQAVGQRVETAVIGAVESIEGSLTDALSMGFDMRVSAADAIAQAEGIGVASGAAGQLLEREGGAGTGGSGERGTLGSLAAGTAGGGQAIATGEVTEQRVRGRVGLAGGGITGGSGDFDASVVRSMISRRIRAVQTCYERALRGTPTAAGRVVVRFTIETSGTVSGASAVENSTGDPGIGTCVVSTVSRFRFSPGPEGGSVTVSYPFVFAPQS
jgi:TonB family protein